MQLNEYKMTAGQVFYYFHKKYNRYRIESIQTIIIGNAIVLLVIFEVRLSLPNIMFNPLLYQPLL